MNIIEDVLWAPFINSWQSSMCIGQLQLGNQTNSFHANQGITYLLQLHDDTRAGWWNIHAGTCIELRTVEVCILSTKGFYCVLDVCIVTLYHNTELVRNPYYTVRMALSNYQLRRFNLITCRRTCTQIAFLAAAMLYYFLLVRNYGKHVGYLHHSTRLHNNTYQQKCSISPTNNNSRHKMHCIFKG